MQRRMSGYERQERRRLEAIGRPTLEYLDETLGLEEIINYRMSAAVRHSSLFASPAPNIRRATSHTHMPVSNSMGSAHAADHSTHANASPHNSSHRGSVSESGAGHAHTASVHADGVQERDSASGTTNFLPNFDAIPNEGSSFWLESQPSLGTSYCDGVSGNNQRAFRRHISMLLHVLGSRTKVPLAVNMETVIRGQQVSFRHNACKHFFSNCVRINDYYYYIV